jgi:hypothetical protein
VSQCKGTSHTRGAQSLSPEFQNHKLIIISNTSEPKGLPESQNHMRSRWELRVTSTVFYIYWAQESHGLAYKCLVIKNNKSICK